MIVEDLSDLRGLRDAVARLWSRGSFSSRMISTQSSTHSSQTTTVRPATSLRTSRWLLLRLALLILAPHQPLVGAFECGSQMMLADLSAKVHSEFKVGS